MKRRYTEAYASLVKLRNNQIQVARDIYYIPFQLIDTNCRYKQLRYALRRPFHYPTSPSSNFGILLLGHRYLRETQTSPFDLSPDGVDYSRSWSVQAFQLQ